MQSEKKNSSGPDRVIVTSTLSEKQSTTVHMRYHLFLQHGWFLQNLGKDFIPTNMHTTVVCTPKTAFIYNQPVYNYLRRAKNKEMKKI